MPTVAITGTDGFLGWHTRAVAHTRDDLDVLPIGRAVLQDQTAFHDAVGTADHLVHIAGVNRGSEDEVREGNVQLAQQVAEALGAVSRPPTSLSFANSTQCGQPSPYGEGKAKATEILGKACSDLGIEYRDVVLPNLFGEHGRPGYNSVVATFCHAIANGQDVELRDDKELSLLGVRDASTQLLPDFELQDSPAATEIAVSGMLDLLREFEATYRDGQIPRLDTRFRTQLFNTYRSFTFPSRFPIPLVRREDDRGALVETVRSHGGTGQAFISSTKPGVTRGQHFHLDKIERFVVFEGQARISLRRLFHTEVVSFLVSGDEPAIVDMPTLWSHNITNVGTGTLYTQFWADQLFDPAAPDTFSEDV